MNEKEMQLAIKISGKVDSSLSRSAKVAVDAVKVAGVALAGIGVAVGAGALKYGKEFEAQMSKVQAASEATGSELKALENKAIELSSTGGTAVFTATEVGKAYENMGLAGWNAKQQLAGVSGILNASAGAGEDVAEVSGIITDGLAAFGMKAEESTRFADVMAKTAVVTNTDILGMGEGLKYAGAVAGTLGYTIEDVAASMGAMANAGVKNSQMGTTLRSAMTRLVTPTKKAVESLSDMGVLVDTNKDKVADYNALIQNSDGTMLSWGDAVENIRDKFGKMSKAEQTVAANNIFGKSAMSGMLALINTSDKKYNSLTKSIDNAAGSAEKMANVKLDNLEGDWTKTKSSLQAKGIELYENMKGPLRDFTQDINNFISDIDVGRVLSDLSDIGGKIGDVAGGVIDFGKSVYNFFNAAKIARQESLDKHFGDIALSMEDIDTAAKHIVMSGKLSRVGELMSNVKLSDEIMDNMDTLKNKINSTNWKLSVGIDLKKSDTEQYVQDTKDYVKSAQDYIDQQGMTVKIASELLLDEDSLVIDENDQFFAGLSKSADDLSSKINEKLTVAMKNGLTIDLEDELNGLLTQLDEITQAISTAEAKAKFQTIETNWSGVDLDADSFVKLQEEIGKYTEETKAGLDEAYEQSMTAINARLAMGDMTKTEYDSAKEDYEQGYMANQTQAVMQGYNFMYSTIMDKYGDNLLNGQLSDGDESAVNQMLNDMQPTIDAMSALYDNALKFGDDELSEALAVKVNDYKQLRDATSGLSIEDQARVFARDSTGFLSDIAAEVNNALTLGVGGYFEGESLFPYEADSESGKAYVEANAERYRESISNALNGLPDEVQKVLDKKTYTAKVNIDSEMHDNNDPSTLPGHTVENNSKNITDSSLIGHATGTISNKEHIARVSEGNSKEAIIPINNSARSKSLLETTNRMMGNSGDTFAPVINIHISGENKGIAKEVEKAVEKAVERAWNKKIKNAKRLSFQG